MFDFFTEYKDFFIVLISSLGTYLVTTNVSSRSDLNNILKHQLENVFKPLIVYIEFNISKNDISIEEIKAFSEKCHTILVKQYEYIPDKMVELERNLFSSIEQNEADEIFSNYNKLSKYIRIRFEAIRSKLNLPCNKAANLWPIMNAEEKISYFMERVVLPFVIWMFVYLFIAMFIEIICQMFLNITSAELFDTNNNLFILLLFFCGLITFIIVSKRK